MHDASNMLSQDCMEAMQSGLLFDVLYADDTILLGANPLHVQEYALAVERAGARYGMSLHWGKFQALSISSNKRLQKPDGSFYDDP
eukprot:9480600-Karenia_brevis.AAC.1